MLAHVVLYTSDLPREFTNLEAEVNEVHYTPKYGVDVRSFLVLYS